MMCYHYTISGSLHILPHMTCHYLFDIFFIQKQNICSDTSLFQFCVTVALAFACYTFGHKSQSNHNDVIKWKYLRYWPFVRGIHRSPLNSPHKGQWRGALMFSLICAWINDWVNSCEAGDLRRHCAHYDVTVMATNWMIPQLWPVLYIKRDIACSSVCSGAHQRKHQSSTSLIFVREVHRWPVDSHHKGQVKRKMLPFDVMSQKHPPLSSSSWIN